jgi:hypothetical protein
MGVVSGPTVIGGKTDERPSSLDTMRQQGPRDDGCIASENTNSDGYRGCELAQPEIVLLARDVVVVLLETVVGMAADLMPGYRVRCPSLLGTERTERSFPS